MMANVRETKDFLDAKLDGFKPDVALVVGSGLGGITQGVAKPIVIPYTDIPHFPKPTVAGHAGQMIFGELADKKLMVLSGRFHRYEGRSPAEITYPMNAAGGINPQYKPGDLMVIEDHINQMGINPLIGGINGDGGIKFIDMSQAYSPRLREKMDAAAEKSQIPIWRGVYLATTGPSYETPAEIKAFAWIGADAVGMSTVPEVIVARYHNIEVAGVSCITNLAAGISSKKLSHDEVLEVGRAAQGNLAKLLTEFMVSL